MRLVNEGAFYTVKVSEAEVAAFASRWPGFGPIQRYSFTFATNNGDLVDVQTPGIQDDNDGHGLAALSLEAQAYGQSKLKGGK